MGDYFLSSSSSQFQLVCEKKDVEKYCLKDSIITKAVFGKNSMTLVYVDAWLVFLVISAGLRSFKPTLVYNDIEKETVCLFKVAPEKYRKFLDKQQKTSANVSDEDDNSNDV